MMPFPPPQYGSVFRKEESVRQKCQWRGCFEEYGEIRWAIDQYSTFCSVFCREEHFSSIGGGDSRGTDPNRTTFEEVKYIRSLPSPA